MNNALRTLTGTVTSKNGAYTVVTCQDAPAYLQIINIDPTRSAGAVVGDRVEVTYVSGRFSGLWAVTRKF